MKNLTNEQAANGSSYKTANLLSDLDQNFTEVESERAPVNNPTFTGAVTLPGTPSASNEAATKGYVDAAISSNIIWVDPVEDIVAVLANGIPLGDRYILSTDNHIYTSNGDNTWSDGGVPTTGTTCYVKSDNDAGGNEVGHYNYNGTSWVYIGASGNHNDLNNIDGGAVAEYYHLTSAQHTIATQSATTTRDGYLTQTDWDTFNNKAPTANPTFTGAVTVPNDSFTYAKLQNASPDIVLGRTGTAGDVEEIACTAAGRALIDDATTAAQRTTIGLGNVTNESKATMFNSPTFTGTVTGITKSMVGLGSVDNTADLSKPISSAQQTALNLKANIASPTLTGTPAAPTAVVGTSTTQIATTAFVQNQLVAGTQYRVFTDGVTTFREGVRSTYFVLDQTRTATGFAGVEGVDWDCVRQEKLP